MRIAFELLERGLLHAGQMGVAAWVEGDGGLGVVKEMGMRDLRERGWGVERVEAGQRGCIFGGWVTGLRVEEGVREGTQKEGRGGLADWWGC